MQSLTFCIAEHSHLRVVRLGRISFMQRFSTLTLHSDSVKRSPIIDEAKSADYKVVEDIFAKLAAEKGRTHTLLEPRIIVSITLARTMLLVIFCLQY